MRLVSAVALLGALTVASATNCDEYSFCEDPGMTIIDGNYKFGQSYHDQTCLATTENAQSFSMMVAQSSTHVNGTVTVNLLAKNNDYGAAVGARLAKTATNLETSVCRGYTGYWCYLNRFDTKGSEYLTVKLEMKKCGESSMSSLAVGTTSSETISLDVGLMYKLRFVLVGNDLKCGILPYSTSSESDNYLAEIETNDNDYQEGVMGIANWGTSWYYKNSTSCDLPTGPTALPTTSPSYSPSPEPSLTPSSHPTTSPTVGPTPYPSVTPSATPSMVPFPAPSATPSYAPSAEPSFEPTHAPMPAPSPAPTETPSQRPTPPPTLPPSSRPTEIPTTGPTPYPSAVPTAVPTPAPTVGPTPYPSATPSATPSFAPSQMPIPAPTAAPSQTPSQAPTSTPTKVPSSHPSSTPSQLPTKTPSMNPSIIPSPSPTVMPSISPTETPTIVPSPSPTHLPSQVPTGTPTPAPTESPTDVPSPSPTGAPSFSPTTPDPSAVPTYSPTKTPTEPPSRLPTTHPTRSPTLHPTGHPSLVPSPSPTETPTSYPSEAPSFLPSPSPTHSPSSLPTPYPTYKPSPSPTHTPTSLPTPHPTGQPTLSPTTWEPTSLPTAFPTSIPTPAPTLVPTVGPTPFPSPVPTVFPTISPTFVPTVSPTTYCYSPEDEDIDPVYSFIETIGGDMVSWIYAHYLEIDAKVDELWLPYLGTDKGNEPGGKTHYTPNGPGPGPPSVSSFGRTLKSTQERSELKKLVSGFTSGAHLVNDVKDTRTERKTADLAQDSKHTFIKATDGVPVSTAMLMACAALALGVAFQNQKAWTEMSSNRFSRAEYSALI